MSRTIELLDVTCDTTVRLSWPESENQEPMVRFQRAGRPALTLPASVVELAAAVLRNPDLLVTAAQG